MTRAVTLLLVGLVIIAGACLLDGDHVSGGHPCGPYLARSTGIECDPLGLTGTLEPLSAQGAVRLAPDQPVPPPRS
jgi:hypothetical protein